MAKLHHGVAELLDEAAAVLDTTKIECKNICSQIVVCIYVLSVLFYFFSSTLRRLLVSTIKLICDIVLAGRRKCVNEKRKEREGLLDRERLGFSM